MNPLIQQDPEIILDGARYRQSHKASVIGILGSRAPEVYSRGSLFYNQDNWTLRNLTMRMCKWAHDNPGCTPTYDDVCIWVSEANEERVANRAIVIASTPDKLPVRMACALTGGGYHEAFHTYYSCRESLNVSRIADMILPRWASLQDWSKYHDALQKWSNLIEDIRIERCGRKEFEGTFVPLCDLQDFILAQEAAGDEKSSGQIGAMDVIVRTFRDVGLGYNTISQQEALKKYQQANSMAVEIIRKGPLAGLLEQSINLTTQDNYACLQIAMDVIIALGELAGEDKEENKSKDGEAGDGGQKCPSCGASASHLKVRPISDGKGGKVPGRGVVTCTSCGWQTETDIEEKPDTGPQQGSGETPQFEGFDEPDGKSSNKDSKSGSGKSEKDPSGNKTGGKGKSEDSEEESDGNPSGKDTKDEDDKSDEGEEGSAGSSADSESTDKKEGTGKGTAGGDGPSEDGEGENPKGVQSGEDSDSGESSGNGAGGHDFDPNPIEGNDWSQIASDAINQASEINALDNNSALEGSMSSLTEKLDSDVQVGEAPWKPYDPSLDTFGLVSPSSKGRTYDSKMADLLIQEVKSESAYLRARLRNIVRALEMTNTVHGVPKGRGLSQRFLVDSRVTLKAGEFPQKAYFRKGQQIDMSMACAVVLDESGSMDSSLRDVTRIMIALTEPFDALKCPTMVIGFRDGKSANRHEGGAFAGMMETVRYHRYEGVHYDIFKMWHERFNTVKWRFANTQARGGTPMADGIQYALRALDQRMEAHRFMFVVTDGWPNSGHTEIIKRQTRIAREAGVHIIGIGMGQGARCVQTLFEDYVWVPDNNISALPKLLVAKLNELVDKQSGKRGKQIRGLTA